MPFTVSIEVTQVNPKTFRVTPKNGPTWTVTVVKDSCRWALENAQRQAKLNEIVGKSTQTKRDEAVFTSKGDNPHFVRQAAEKLARGVEHNLPYKCKTLMLNIYGAVWEPLFHKTLLSPLDS